MQGVQVAQELQRVQISLQKILLDPLVPLLEPFILSLPLFSCLFSTADNLLHNLIILDLPL